MLFRGNIAQRKFFRVRSPAVVLVAIHAVVAKSKSSLPVIILFAIYLRSICGIGTDRLQLFLSLSACAGFAEMKSTLPAIILFAIYFVLAESKLKSRLPAIIIVTIR